MYREKDTQMQPMKYLNVKWGKVFKNGPSNVCGRQPIKKFIWSTLEYFDPNIFAKYISCGKISASISVSYRIFVI